MVEYNIVVGAGYDFIGRVMSELMWISWKKTHTHKQSKIFAQAKEENKKIATHPNTRIEKKKKINANHTWETYKRLSRLLWPLDPIKTQRCMAVICCRFVAPVQYSHNFDGACFFFLSCFFCYNFCDSRLAENQYFLFLLSHVKHIHTHTKNRHTNIVTQWAKTKRVRISKVSTRFGWLMKTKALKQFCLMELTGLKRKNGKTTKRHFFSVVFFKLIGMKRSLKQFRSSLFRPVKPKWHTTMWCNFESNFSFFFWIKNQWM